jgi:imidazole glycerol-phosphate synthase subunit HisH
MKLVIVDYGAGNLHSVAKAVQAQGVKPMITTSARYLDEADALIVPGVGAAEDTMSNLRRCGLVEPIKNYIESGRPFLGVCMGQQALFQSSEENGFQECLGVLPGRIVKLQSGADHKVPHMGWNRVNQLQPHPIFDGIDDGAYFYFVHSYVPQPEDPSITIGETDYGVKFASVVARDNVVATQFHPEKSGETGLRMYANFISIVGRN